jgi:hypothetical protein
MGASSSQQMAHRVQFMVVMKRVFAASVQDLFRSGERAVS